MSKILVVYSTNSGSTPDVAHIIAEELRVTGRTVEVHPLTAFPSIDDFDFLIFGAPMIFGWHAAVRRFLRRNRKQIAGKKVAYFACALRLTGNQKDKSTDTQLTIDPALVSPPEKPGALSLKERFTTTRHYLTPMLKTVPEIKPVSVAFFNGKLDLRRLKWWQVLFVLGVVQAKPGDYRDWEFIRHWARNLIPLLTDGNSGT